MSLTRAQQILLKRAQQQAGVDDAEYRSTLSQLSYPDCHSSTDPRLTDRHLDIFLAYFEAIYFRRLDRGEVAPPDFTKRLTPVFQQPGYWAVKNRNGNTSRDRYAEKNFDTQRAALENQLAKMGYGLRYFQAIQNRIRPFSQINYIAALKRTLAAKQRKQHANEPF